MTGGAPPRRTHLVALDGLRGAAIVMVMFVHFLGDLSPHSLPQRVAVKLANYGVWGVDLFFVLSGFLITGILYDDKSSKHYFRDFYVRRTLRIFPLYYGVLALLFIVWPALALPYPAGLADAGAHQGWLWSYTTNVYVALRGTWTPVYVSHFWSLAVEEHFYLLWPLVVWSFGSRSLLRICAGASIFALFTRCALSLAGATDVALVALTPCRLDALCIGAALAIALRSERAHLVERAAKPALCFFATSVLAISAINAVFPSLRAVVVPLRGTLVALAFGALLVTSISAKPEEAIPRACRSRTMRFFGKYSYGLYVFHGIIAVWLVDHGLFDRVSATLGSNGLAMAAFAIIGAAVSLLVSIASYELYEKRFIGLKDRLAPSKAEARLS